MNILHVINRFDPREGGVAQAVRSFINGQHNSDVRHEVVCLDSAESNYLKDDSFVVHALGLGSGPWCYNPDLIPWLINNCQRFDSIIIHGLWLFPSYAVRSAINSHQKKFLTSQSVYHTSEAELVISHSLVDNSPSKTSGVGSIADSQTPRYYAMPHGMLDPYFQKASGRKLKAIRNWAYWKLIESKVVNEANGILFTCEEELRLAQEPFSPYHPKNVSVVGLGIEDPPEYTLAMSTSFYKHCSPELKERPYFLFLSRIHEKKGVDILLEAYASIIQEGSNNDLPALVIAGPGLETAYGQKIKEFASSKPTIKNSVFFTGMLTGDAKWGAFYRCEAFILPSHQENFGIAVVEASACGKPVLISDQVNIWREIKKSGAGFVESDSIEGVRNLILKWLKLSEEQKITIKQKARESFQNNFAIGPASARLVDAVSYK